RFEITQGHIGFTDAAVNPTAKLGVSELSVAIDQFTLADNATMPFTANFSLDGGGHVEVNGTAVAMPAARVDAQFKVEELALAAANPYLNAQTYLQVAGGALGVDGHVQSSPEETLAFDGAVNIAGLDVQREGLEGKLTGMRSFSLSGLTLSLAQKRIDIARA